MRPSVVVNFISRSATVLFLLIAGLHVDVAQVSQAGSQACAQTANGPVDLSDVIRAHGMRLRLEAD